MDGQLGCGEENSLYPCLVERFQELGTPDSLVHDPNNDGGGTPLKVVKSFFLTAVCIL